MFMDSADTTKIKERIIDILDKLFSDVGIDKNMLEFVDLIDDLGMDSIFFVSLMIELETEFGIRIPDEWMMLNKFQNFYLISNVVETLLNEKAMRVSYDK